MAAPMVKTRFPGIYRRGSRYTVVYRDPSGRKRKLTARTLAEARDLQARVKADVARGEYRDPGNVTLAEYVETWIESYQGRTSRGFREATRADYRSALTRHALPVPRFQAPRRDRPRRREGVGGADREDRRCASHGAPRARATLGVPGYSGRGWADRVEPVRRRSGCAAGAACRAVGEAEGARARGDPTLPRMRGPGVAGVLRGARDDRAARVGGAAHVERHRCRTAGVRRSAGLRPEHDGGAQEPLRAPDDPAGAESRARARGALRGDWGAEEGVSLVFGRVDGSPHTQAQVRHAALLPARRAAGVEAGLSRVPPRLRVHPV